MLKHKPGIMSATTIVLFVTLLVTALITGLWYAFSCSVNWGLGKLGDREYLLAMQSINRAILNPVFFATFIGALILLPVSTWLAYKQPGSAGWAFLLAASIIYLIGVFGVTAGGNVPLNDALNGFDVEQATVQSVANARQAFEGPWNRLHTIRGIASFVALIFLLIGFVEYIKGQAAL